MFALPRSTVVSSPSHASRVSERPSSTSGPTISARLRIDVSFYPNHSLTPSFRHETTWLIYTTALTLWAEGAISGVSGRLLLVYFIDRLEHDCPLLILLSVPHGVPAFAAVVS